MGHRNMLGVEKIRQRLALLKQQERELRLSFCQSHASLAESAQIDTKLVTLAVEIAELESLISDRPIREGV